MIHINTRYQTTEEAFGRINGALILGVSFQLSPTDNPTLETLIDNFGPLLVVNSTVAIDSLEPLITLITETSPPSHVFDYVGSLTTPPCTENIRWLILSEQLDVSARQMTAFRSSFQDDSGRILTLNFRPTQPRNGREIFGESISIDGLHQ